MLTGGMLTDKEKLCTHPKTCPIPTLITNTITTTLGQNVDLRSEKLQVTCAYPTAQISHFIRSRCVPFHKLSNNFYGIHVRATCHVIIIANKSTFYNIKLIHYSYNIKPRTCFDPSGSPSGKTTYFKYCS
jgi:hypothetical protein